MSSMCQLDSVDCSVLQQMGVTSERTVQDENLSCVDFNNVRITPPRFEFKGAFEGKHFKAKITLQNIGKTIVFIRMTTPTSYAYEIKCFPRGMHLSPGLTIERYVELNYSQVCVKLCILPIYVNEQRYDFELEVSVSTSELKVSPSFIDFGCVDAGLTSPPKVVELVNAGTKGTRYSFDLVGTQHELIIDPIKGYIGPKQSVLITLRLLTYKEGMIETELWIRCENPIFIAVQGLVITAKFEAIHPNATSTFTVVDFPTTYYKSSYTKSLLIRNYSSTNSMFCVLGELRDGRMLSLKSCRQINKCFKYFDVCPSEGRFEPKETKLFQLTFQPRKLKKDITKMKGYYFVAIQIRKVTFRDLIPTGTIFEDEILQTISANNISTASFFVETLHVQSGAPLFRSSSSARNVNMAVKAARPFVRVYLHGLAEDPSVSVIPEEFVFLDMKVNTKTTRVLELQNNSTYLPIILHYKKVAYIELERNIFLKPNEKKQVSIVIAHHCIGMLNTQIEFDLLHYDTPKTEDNCKLVGNIVIPVTLESIAITKYPIPEISKGLQPNYIKEVGLYCDNLKYSNIMDRPKTIMVDITKPSDRKRNELIAFPNDKPTSLRPWRSNNPCTTIFAKKPRYIPPLDETHELSIFDREFKRQVTAYYVNFMRREAEKLKSLLKTPMKIIEDEYSFAETYKVNFNNVPTLCGIMKPSQKIRADSFLPLSPIELNMISVSPTVIETGKIACYNGYNMSLVITNANPLSLRLFFKPDKPIVLFPQTNRRVIAPNSQNQVEMIYTAGPPGYYVVTIDILVNESTITQVVILADVVIHTLQLNSYNIQLTDGKTHEYIDITNNLNVTINYFWDIPFCNFCVEPYNGSVRPYSTLTGVLTYYSHIGGPNVVDIEFHSGDKDVQFVKVTCELPKEEIELITKQVSFGNIPLNIRVTRVILFRNPFCQALSFSVIESELGEQLEVLPRDGIIAGKQLLGITLGAKFQNCIRFSTVIKIDVTKAGIFDVPVTGNVVYPSLKITPDNFQFKTVPFSSTDCLKFTIKNQSAAIATVQINLSDYQEYKICEEKFHWELPVTDEIVLEPDKSKTLYIHYMPIECAISAYYLPMVINGILGPPIISDPITLKVDYYLKARYKSTETVNVPINLDVVKVTGLAKAGKIIFSKLGIDFTLGIRAERRYKTKYELKITNCQRDSEEVCVRTDELRTKPFLLEALSENVELHLNSAVCSLEPNQCAVIGIEFCPVDYGHYKCFLPVYLRSDMSLSFHNVIELRGNYITPIIVGERLTFVMAHGGLGRDPTIKTKDIPRKMTFYSRPIPLKIVACSTKKYIFRDHHKICAIHIKTNLPGLTIQIQDDTFSRLNDNDYEVEMTFKYSTEENTQFISSIQISCSCGGLWEANLIGCAENCFLTSYAFSETFLPEHLDAVTMLTDARKGYSMDLEARPSLMSAVSRRDIGRLLPEEFHTMEFFSSYPFFPSEVTALMFFLERCAYCMEEWLCNQVFYKTIRYQIPETIIYEYVAPKSQKAGVRAKGDTKGDLLIPPYAKLLINMVGPQMITYLKLGPAPKTEEELCWYLYTVYENAIYFIKSLGAYFICLKPEHLLSYNMFVSFKKYILPTLGTDVATTTTSIKNSQEFYYLAKQTWLDVLLQTYKVLYLYRLSAVLMSPPSNPSICPLIKPLEEFKKSVKDFRKNANIFSNAELLLINWLEYHYMTSKNEIWGENNKLPKRDVNFFGENLQDGFIFAAVTGAYCPYMIPYLRKMFLDADMFEELLHNNCIVTRCWEMLNFSFTIKPEDILDPNSVQMLTLIAYLFEVLPNMYPAETIEFDTGLSEVITKSIVLQNINDFPICYKAIFFTNCGECFSSDQEMYIIPKNKSAKITITYHAKYAKEIKCTLLLSGENAGYHYARNRSFTLIGMPDITYMTSTITYPIYLYQVSDVTFTIKSPYVETASYDMQITYKLIQSLDELATVPFVRKAEMLHLSKLIPNERCGSFDNGIFDFQGSCSAISMEDQTVWIYFRNKDVGDFAIHLIMQVKPSTLKEVIDVVLPKNFTDLIHSKSKRVLEHIFIEIPCQNRLLWNTIKEVMLRVSEGDVLQFWKKNIGTPIGMQILQQIVLGTEAEYFSDVCNAATYRIITDKNCEAILQDSLIIENECSPNFVKIPLHFHNYNEIPRNFSFSLHSLDGRTRRYYVTNFVFQ